MSSKALNRSLEAKLAALDGPEWDNSGDEEEEDDVVVNLGSTKESFGGKGTKNKKLVPSTMDKESSVIYLGHLPVAFEEHELRGFLSQFGEIKRLRVARSKKTANPKGYAFCEFDDPKVAAIVAETMGGYLLLEKRLVCHVVPPEKVHPRMFHGSTEWKQIDWRKLHRDQVNQKRSDSKLKKITARLKSRDRKKREKLQEMGIDYGFPGYSASEPAKKVETPKSGKKSREDNVTPESSTKKRRKMSHDEKESKSSSKKKKRKNSNADSEEGETVTPAKEESEPPKAQTDIKKKKKKKKADKKRRVSVP